MSAIGETPATATTWATDVTLSFTARGILAAILASPADNPVSVTAYQSLTWLEGHQRIAAAFRELSSAGYLHHVRKRGGGRGAGTAVRVLNPPGHDCGNPDCLDCRRWAG